MASPTPPGIAGVLTGQGRARRSSFTSAERFPGDDSDDDESSISSQSGIEPAITASLASSASSRCSRPTPADSPELGGRLAGAPAAAQSAPQLPSLGPPEHSVQRSITFCEGQPRRRYSREALKLVQAATRRAIEASLSMHDVSYYGQMLASSEPPPGREHLLFHAGSSRVSTSPDSATRGAISLREEIAEPAPLTPGLYVQVFFAVVKSYVGPAILYLPHAFSNGGMLPSLLLLPFLGCLTTAAFYLLVQCHTSAAGAPTYGDMAALALGRPGRLAVTVALVGAQLSTITSYYMFVARNLRDSAQLYGWTLPADNWLIPLLMPVFAPLACLPQLRHLAPTNILADLLILAGLAFVACYAVTQLSEPSVGPAANSTAEPSAADAPHFAWFQAPGSLLLYVGTTCFTFEGGGLMVPIVCSLEPRQKHVFGPIFLQAMAFVTLLFTGFGALGYACFGEDTVMPVTLNVHTAAASGAGLRLGYSFAVVCTFPLQMMPIADMVEAALAAPPCHLRRPSVGRRLIARLGLIGLTCTVAVYGANQFDHFISLVGVLCSVPLAFALPSLSSRGCTRHVCHPGCNPM